MKPVYCFSILALLQIFTVVVSESNWPTLNFTLEIASRAQRDISKLLPISQITTVGISLSSIFRNSGYTVDALSPLYDLLNGGNEAIMIDLYWNEFTSQWQLCPAPFPSNTTYNMNDVVDLLWENNDYQCQPGLSTENIMGIINSYIRDTNTNIGANFLRILFNLKSIHYENSNRTIDLQNIYKPSILNPVNIGNDTLNDTIASLGSYIFTPTVLSQYQSDASHVEKASSGSSINSTQAISYFYNQSNIIVPSLDTVLLSEYKRVSAHILSNELVNSSRVYQFTSYDTDLIFFNDVVPLVVENTTTGVAGRYCNELFNAYNSTGVDIETFNNLSLTTRLRFIVDSDENPFTVDTLSKFVRCGYSAIFNGTSDVGVNSSLLDFLDEVDEFIPYGFWSWSPGQPVDLNDTNSDSINNASMSSNNTDDSNGNSLAFKCVVLTETGWSVANCYDRHVIACQNLTSRNNWVLQETNKRNYFEIDKGDCPEGYTFSIPRLSTEMLSLQATVKQRNVPYPIWLDLNDITVPNCFVSGGPYAQCPYQRTITTNKFVRMIAPSFAVGVVVLVLILIENIFRTNPIQTNRKRYWKKAIQEYYNKNDFEGVPS